jgi:hypothetical protein
MPRTSLTAGAHHDEGRPEKFPQVKLERGEGRRLWVPDEDIAFMEYRHSIQAPVFDAATGEPLKTEKKVRGSMRTVYDMSFETGGYIGGPICLGVPDVIRAEKLDPDGCPVCAGVKRLLDAGIADALDLRPLPRYAVPVVQYVTASKTDLTKLRTPPSADILIWALSQWSWEQVDGIRGQMAEILNLEDAAAVKLQMCDILVSNENGFQKIDKIRPARRAWAVDTDFGRAIKAVVQELWMTAENRPTDDQLQAACGRKADREYVEQDIRDAEERWHRAERWGKGGPADASGGNYLANGQQAASLEDGLDLLEGVPVPESVMAEHPGGLGEFAERSQPAAADDGGLSGSPEAGPAALPDDDPFGVPGSPLGAVAEQALGEARAEAAALVSAAGLGDDPLAATPAGEPVVAGNGSGNRETQSFKDLWDSVS